MDKYDSADQIIETMEMLRNRLDQISDELPDVVEDYHKLFPYFVAQAFEAIDPKYLMDQRLVCDQQLEHGIDFYYTDENRFVAYQCKVPETENLPHDIKMPKFDDDIVNEAEDALSFLTDDSGQAKGNKFSQYARNKYRQMRESCLQDGRKYKLEVILAFLGELTTPAERKLDELKGTWEKDIDEFEIKTINYHHIASDLRLSLIAPTRPDKIRLEYKPKTAIHTNDWGYALVPAINFVGFFEEYKMGLFDLNGVNP